MGSLLHPVGPLPPGAYWLRRVVALVAVVVVLLLLWWAVGALAGGGAGGGAGGSGGPPPTTGPPSGTPSGSQPGSPRPSASATPTTTSAAPAATTAAATGLCPSSAIKVAVSTNKASYGPTDKPQFTLRVTNTGGKACRRDVGRAALGLVVAKGGTRFWSSDDCAPGGAADLRLLGAGGSYRTTVVWQRTASEPGCPSGQPSAPAGSYTLVGRDLDVSSQAVPFTLR